MPSLVVARGAGKPQRCMIVIVGPNYIVWEQPANAAVHTLVALSSVEASREHNWRNFLVRILLRGLSNAAQ